MKKFAGILSLILLALAVLPSAAQDNQPSRLPEIGKEHTQNVYTTYETGFWIAPEASVGYSCRIAHKNNAFSELTVTGGYRFNEFVRVGVGFGGRLYFHNTEERYRSKNWAFPLFLNVRGNFIPTDTRDVVPYYSMDLGAAIRDGFMMRPTFGLRIGQKRSAFLVGLSYLGQNTKFSRHETDGRIQSYSKFLSFITLRLGYEF